MAKKSESSFLTDLISAHEQRLGERCYMATEGEKRLMGLQLPSLALMYLFELNILPLGRGPLGIAGPSMSQKSSLGFEIMRWVCAANGYAALAECEGGKFSPSLLRALMRETYDRLLIGHCQTIDEAQSFMTTTLESVQKNDPKRQQVFGLMLDSIAGVATESMSDKLFDEGSVGRAFPEAALYWTNFYKPFTARLMNWPFLFLTINHLKEKPQQTASGAQYMVPTTPGGVAQRFHSAFYLHVRRVGSDHKIEAVENGKTVRRPRDVRMLSIKMDKSSLGIDGRHITVEFIRGHNEDGSENTYFDWPAADATLLSYLLGDKSEGVDKKGLRERCDVTVGRGLYSSKRLGCDDVSAHEFGTLLKAAPDVMGDLTDFLHIKQYQVIGEPPPTKKAAVKEDSPVQQ